MRRGGMLGRITGRRGVRTVHGVRWPAKNHINHPHDFLRNYSQKDCCYFQACNLFIKQPGPHSVNFERFTAGDCHTSSALN